MLMWPTYTNIGVDDRSQFDLFVAMPGGLPAVKDAVTQLHPGYGEYRPGVGTRQAELVLLTVIQQVQTHCRQIINTDVIKATFLNK